ncbi:MAG: hypothetical protein ACK5SX_13170 [Sandaracinobacter sp.]
MNVRFVLLVLLLAPVLIFGARLLRQEVGAERLLPGLERDAVARIEIARGREQVVLARRLDTGAWEVLSAAEAPGDAARIAATIDRLARLKGKPLPPGKPPQSREPLQVRLSDAKGTSLGHAAFWTYEAARLPGGERLAIADAPALPLWQSAWSSLQPPRIVAGEVAAVERLTAEGPVALSTDAAVEVARMLGGLQATDFVSGATVSWAGASLLRVRMADGTVIDLQQVPDGEGRFHLRMTSDTRTDIRAARRYAFRVEKPLP